MAVMVMIVVVATVAMTAFLVIAIIATRLGMILCGNRRTRGTADASADHRALTPAHLGANRTANGATDRTANRGIRGQITRLHSADNQRQHSYRCQFQNVHVPLSPQDKHRALLKKPTTDCTNEIRCFCVPVRGYTTKNPAYAGFFV
jgi:hypothetical protein